jgi:hypothetical protein
MAIKRERVCMFSDVYCFMIAEHMYWCLVSLRCMNRRWQTRPRRSRSRQPAMCGGGVVAGVWCPRCIGQPATLLICPCSPRDSITSQRGRGVGRRTAHLAHSAGSAATWVTITATPLAHERHVRLVLLRELQTVLGQDTVRHGPHRERVHQGTRIRRIQLVCVGTRIWMWVLVIVLVLVFVRVRDVPNVRVTQYTERWTDEGASTLRSDKIP